MPVLGLIFLKHAYNRFQKVKIEVETSRFPDGVYADVEGLCKVVNQTEIEAKDWSLSPGRYVGVDTATDEDFDYEKRLNEIHIELEGLNKEAGKLSDLIQGNYKSIL
jgi:type I restriction enzyme M protein